MGSRRQPDFARLLGRLARGFVERDIPFMLIGGQAVLLHGEPRLTPDIDIAVGAAPDRFEDVVALCTALGLRPLPEDATAFVRETSLLPAADPATGIRVDLIFSDAPYATRAIARAVHVEVGGEPVPFASAEDLILIKLLAGRARDLEDAAGVVRRRAGRIDWQSLREWAQELARSPGREDLPDRLTALRREAEER